MNRRSFMQMFAMLPGAKLFHINNLCEKTEFIKCTQKFSPKTIYHFKTKSIIAITEDKDYTIIYIEGIKDVYIEETYQSITKQLNLDQFITFKTPTRQCLVKKSAINLIEDHQDYSIICCDNSLINVAEKTEQILEMLK